MGVEDIEERLKKLQKQQVISWGSKPSLLGKDPSRERLAALLNDLDSGWARWRVLNRLSLFEGHIGEREALLMANAIDMAVGVNSYDHALELAARADMESLARSDGLQWSQVAVDVAKEGIYHYAGNGTSLRLGRLLEIEQRHFNRVRGEHVDAKKLARTIAARTDIISGEKMRLAHYLCHPYEEGGVIRDYEAELALVVMAEASKAGFLELAKDAYGYIGKHERAKAIPDEGRLEVIFAHAPRLHGLATATKEAVRWYEHVHPPPVPIEAWGKSNTYERTRRIAERLLKEFSRIEPFEAIRLVEGTALDDLVGDELRRYALSHTVRSPLKGSAWERKSIYEQLGLGSNGQQANYLETLLACARDSKGKPKLKEKGRECVLLAAALLENGGCGGIELIRDDLAFEIGLLDLERGLRIQQKIGGNDAVLLDRVLRHYETRDLAQYADLLEQHHKSSAVVHAYRGAARILEASTPGEVQGILMRH